MNNLIDWFLETHSGRAVGVVVAAIISFCVVGGLLAMFESITH